jgi:hypothetical protein
VLEGCSLFRVDSQSKRNSSHTSSRRRARRDVNIAF